MKDGEAFEYKDFGMAGLFQAISGNMPTGKIGILGDKDSREGGSSNATIGLKHELGEDGLPVRSFLRMPLIEKMQKYLDKTDAFDEESLHKVLYSGKMNIWMRRILSVGEQVIADAFQSGGFGNWKASDMTYKKVHQTLVESQQLRDSITAELD